ncbi:MAG: hypothetical protein AB1696_19300 [Planctomycetota bacterium]
MKRNEERAAWSELKRLARAAGYPVHGDTIVATRTGALDGLMEAYYMAIAEKGA